MKRKFLLIAIIFLIAASILAACDLLAANDNSGIVTLTSSPKETGLSLTVTRKTATKLSKPSPASLYSLPPFAQPFNSEKYCLADKEASSEPYLKLLRSLKGRAALFYVLDVDENGRFTLPVKVDIESNRTYKKPVIYLYPTEPTEVSVQLDYKGTLEVTYPEYNDGWNVIAYPDGRLINHRDNREYSYLFWEGISDAVFNTNHGFVVKGSDTATFLQEKLAYMGLTPHEYNEFIVFWLPLMQKNAYNLISFQEETYTESAVLQITPEPDSMLRVFMTYKPLDESIEISEQVLKPFERRGFTVVEWGGTEIIGE